MAYQYNAVGSAPKILGQTFIVDKLEQLADNPYANRLGVVKCSYSGNTYYCQITPGATNSLTSSTIGSIISGVSGSSNTWTSFVESLKMSSCVVDSKTYYGYKTSQFYFGQASNMTFPVGLTFYALVYDSASETINLVYNTLTSSVSGGSGSNGTVFFYVPRALSADIVLAVWCEETA